MNLRDAVVLITGPARGIGAETARRLAARGARLALVGLEPERLAALAAELGDGHAWAECDVTDQASLERAVAAMVAAHGRIDVVVANAGIASHGTVATTSADAMARTIAVNLVGVVRTVAATLPHVRARRGYFLLVSSAAAIAPLPGIAAYAASKSGVEQFANVLRLELAHVGVGVGTAHPSWIATEMVSDPRGDLPAFDAVLGRLPGPFGRVTPVRQCAEAFVAAIEGRRRKVFVPASVGAFSMIRQLITSRLGDAVLRWRGRELVPQLEREVTALGRAFGAHSVEARQDVPATGGGDGRAEG